MDNYNTKEEELKECLVCNKLLPKTTKYFQKNGIYLKSPCKECARERRRLYYEQNKESIKVYSRLQNKKETEARIAKRKKHEIEITGNGNWKEVKDFESYLVSDEGEVFSRHHGKLLAVGLKDEGYNVVNLWKNNKGHMKYVHRLVLKHFGNEDRNETVNHKDGIKTNNHISNLEWMSYGDNNRHAIETGLRNNHKNNPRMSMRVNQSDLNGNLIKTYPSMRQAERETGVDATAIGHGIRKGWKCGGFKWSLADGEVTS